MQCDAWSIETLRGPRAVAMSGWLRAKEAPVPLTGAVDGVNVEVASCGQVLEGACGAKGEVYADHR